MDRITSAKRSEIMSKVRHGNTDVELMFRKGLWKKGVRGYRIAPNVPGRPDIYFPRKKVAIFVDGCFWHGCRSCKRIPKSNVEFWTNKIRGNRARDRRVDKELKRSGVKVIRIWEHEVKQTLEKCASKICRIISDTHAQAHRTD